MVKPEILREDEGFAEWTVDADTRAENLGLGVLGLTWRPLGFRNYL